MTLKNSTLGIWHCWGSCDQAVIPPLHPVLTEADPRAPRQPQDQTPVGGPHTEVGIKSKLNPGDGVTKEEDRKSFLQLYKLQIKSPRSAR